MATIQTINISSANDGLGDPLRTAFDKTNQNNTALNNDLATKAPLASPTFTGTVILPLNTSIGTVSSTEIGYVDGVTSAIQTQLNDKAPLASPTITGTLTAVNDAIINGLTVGKGNGNVSGNLALGAAALLTNTTGYNNTAIGTQSLQQNTSGYENTALGNAALYDNTVFFNVTAIGSNSQASASNQVVIGNTNVTTTILRGAVSADKDAIFNGIKVGKGSGNVTSNTVIGNSTLTANTTGEYNSAFGKSSMLSNQTGSRNTAYGGDSLFNNVSGNFNVAIGNSALENTTGNDNTAIGYAAGAGNTSFFNITCLGANTAASASNQVNLGNTNVNSLRCNVQVITSLSDKRDKKDILEISEGLDFVSKLKPVTFTWNQRDGGRVGIKSAGFIAQDLLELQNDSLIGENLDLVSNDNPEQLEARYANLMPIMIKAIQELKAEIELLKSK